MSCLYTALSPKQRHFIHDATTTGTMIINDLSINYCKKTQNPKIIIFKNVQECADTHTNTGRLLNPIAYTWVNNEPESNQYLHMH